MNDNDSKLFNETKELIKLFRNLPDKENIEKFESWIKNTTQNEIAKNSQEERLLAEILIGLSKNIDYLIDLRKQDDLNKLIGEIVGLSLQVITSKFDPRINNIKSKHNHEDQACILGSMGHRYNPNKNPIKSKSGWSILPAADSVNFKVEPKPIIISEETKLLRVISLDGNECGHWWFRKKLPDTREKWRSNYAVSELWNTGKLLICFTTSNILKVWAGEAASQRAPILENEPCILKGGTEQIWLDSKDIETSSLKLVSFPLDQWT